MILIRHLEPVFHDLKKRTILQEGVGFDRDSGLCYGLHPMDVMNAALHYGRRNVGMLSDSTFLNYTSPSPGSGLRWEDAESKHGCLIGQAGRSQTAGLLERFHYDGMSTDHGQTNPDAKHKVPKKL